MIILGDVVFFKAGDRIPADLRIIEARGLKVRLKLYLIYQHYNKIFIDFLQIKLM